MEKLVVIENNEEQKLRKMLLQAYIENSRNSNIMLDSANKINNIYNEVASLRQNIFNDVISYFANELEEFKKTRNVTMKLMEFFIENNIITREDLNKALNEINCKEVTEWFERNK